MKRYKNILDRYDSLGDELSKPENIKNQALYRKLGKERSDLEEAVGAIRKYMKLAGRLDEAREVVAGSQDEEFIELARAEIEEVEDEFYQLEEDIKLLLIPRDPDDSRNTVIEIRAGTGGDEAALFAHDLSRMYRLFAENQRWKVDILSSSPTEMGGFKEIIFLVAGDNAYGKLKFESGVHRVQRVPVTESGGRIHTSAVSVAVLPEAEEVDVEVEAKDLKVDVYRSSGPGGQSVNTTDSAVRITHIPTGMVVTCQDEKSQHKNKAKAMKVLLSRLLEKYRSEQADEIAQARKGMVGSGDRSAKIRTYNYPQGRVSDHRIGFTSHNLGGILDGELDELISELALAERENLLALEMKKEKGKATSS
ncbi:MAG: peptide chain release factor 1 [Candidatus Krumholzibacteriota bacterium]|nr:peptide chain release factor 1 [Candidatus Krumholzibacteriota bacterium]